MVYIEVWSNNGCREHWENTTFDKAVDFLKKISPVEKVVIFERWTSPTVKVVGDTYNFNFRFTTNQLEKLMDFLVELNGGKIEERTF